MTKEQEVFINEVNTIPGFTNLSMYPKNWVASGLSYSDLIEDLIELAVSRHHQLSELSHYYLGPSKSSSDASSRGKKWE